MINVRFTVSAILLCSLALVARAQTKPAAPAIPHLEKRGHATQLMVDGKPFLVLGGELSNTVSSDICLLYTSPSPRDRTRSRMPSSA